MPNPAGELLLNYAARALVSVRTFAQPLPAKFAHAHAHNQGAKTTSPILGHRISTERELRQAIRNYGEAVGMLPQP